MAEDTARRLLEVTRQLALELHPERTARLRASLDAHLERDLGLDSLGRAELVLRLEQAFRVQLPERLLAAAETPRDLLTAVLAASATPSPLLSAEVRELAVGPAEAAPDAARTWLEVLEWHASTHPERTHVLLYTPEEREEEISYRALREAARGVAAGLHQRGLARGERVAIMLPTSRAFFEAFFGVLYAGGVPVPIYPPFRPAQLEDHLRRQAGILANAATSLLVADPEARAVSALLRAQVPTLRAIENVAALASEPGGLQPPDLAPTDIALLQYTSGSTGSPKGVVLGHDNMLANVRAIGRVMQVETSDVFVSWLPLYHDMGLIGAWLGSLYHAVPVVILSPLRFLARPESWLWAIHRHRATISAAPNFGFELCVRRLEDSALEGLDLSAWRWAVNGSEPVSPSTIRRFAERFARFGFRPEAMAPVYGLAECSVGLSFPPPGRPPRIERIQRTALSRQGRAVLAAAGDPAALELVACGRPLPGHQVRIVDGTGHEVAERCEGRLQFRGPSATRGYFRNEEKTRALFDGPWLESGDLAYMAGGDVFLTGRSKDIIIRAGRNIHPHEIEEAVGDLPGIRKGCVVVFGSADPRSRTERIVVVAETREERAEAREELRRRVEEAASAILEGPPDEIVLAPPHSVLKTSSGKLRRAASRERYEQGRLGRAPRAVWWQVSRLVAAGAALRMLGGARAAAAFAYGAWWWASLALMALWTWPLVALLPRPSWSWAVLRRAARALLATWRIPVQVEGAARMPEGACVVVANHASYLDGLLLAAALPGPVRFVAKHELAGQLVAGSFLRGLDALFVERADPERGASDAARAVDAVRDGDRLLFFPEATFRRMPGLLPFRLGAFHVAAETGVPVVPVVLQGTRSVLRGDQWLPRRGALGLRIGQPLVAKGEEWRAVIELRDAARAAILRLGDEPDLAEETVSFE